MADSIKCLPSTQWTTTRSEVKLRGISNRYSTSPCPSNSAMSTLHNMTFTSIKKNLPVGTVTSPLCFEICSPYNAFKEPWSVIRARIGSLGPIMELSFFIAFFPRTARTTQGISSLKSSDLEDVTASLIKKRKNQFTSLIESCFQQHYLHSCRFSQSKAIIG